MSYGTASPRCFCHRAFEWRVIMELMGHMLFSTSLIYTHVVPERHNDAAAKLDKAIG